MRFARSQTVALRMSTTHVLAFVGCWTPYLVISAWHIVDPEGVVNDVAPEVQDALFLTAVFNSCINPLVYGGFYFRSVQGWCQFAICESLHVLYIKGAQPTVRTFSYALNFNLEV